MSSIDSISDEDDLRQLIDDSVLTHTGRSIGDMASAEVAAEVRGFLLNSLLEKKQTVVIGKSKDTEYWTEAEEGVLIQDINKVFGGEL